VRRVEELKAAVVGANALGDAVLRSAREGRRVEVRP
jgi:hypothetical protein